MKVKLYIYTLIATIFLVSCTKDTTVNSIDQEINILVKIHAPEFMTPENIENPLSRTTTESTIERPYVFLFDEDNKYIDHKKTKLTGAELTVSLPTNSDNMKRTVFVVANVNAEVEALTFSPTTTTLESIKTLIKKVRTADVGVMFPFAMSGFQEFATGLQFGNTISITNMTRRAAKISVTKAVALTDYEITNIYMYQTPLDTYIADENSNSTYAPNDVDDMPVGVHVKSPTLGGVNINYAYSFPNSGISKNPFIIVEVKYMELVTCYYKIPIIVGANATLIANNHYNITIENITGIGALSKEEATLLTNTQITYNLTVNDLTMHDIWVKDDAYIAVTNSHFVMYGVLRESNILNDPADADELKKIATVTTIVYGKKDAIDGSAVSGENTIEAFTELNKGKIEITDETTTLINNIKVGESVAIKAKIWPNTVGYITLKVGGIRKRINIASKPRLGFNKAHYIEVNDAYTATVTEISDSPGSTDTKYWTGLSVTETPSSSNNLDVADVGGKLFIAVRPNFNMISSANVNSCCRQSTVYVTHWDGCTKYLITQEGVRSNEGMRLINANANSFILSASTINDYDEFVLYKIPIDRVDDYWKMPDATDPAVYVGESDGYHELNAQAASNPGLDLERNTIAKNPLWHPEEKWCDFTNLHPNIALVLNELDFTLSDYAANYDKLVDIVKDSSVGNNIIVIIHKNYSDINNNIPENQSLINNMLVDISNGRIVDKKTLWSYHLWIAPDAMNWESIANDNLGARVRSNSGSPAELKYGLFYQWGRMVPLPQDITKITVAEGTADGINSLIYNSTTFYRGSNYSYVNITASQATVVYHLWQSHAPTIYDPCPHGWMVSASTPQQSNIYNAGKISTEGIIVDKNLTSYYWYNDSYTIVTEVGEGRSVRCVRI